MSCKESRIGWALRLFTVVAAFMQGSAVSGADRFWVAGAGDWNNTLNWSDASGGAGGKSLPGVSDTAIFDVQSGDCLINQNVNVAGLHLRTGYAGTLTQGSVYAITTGAAGFSQAAGRFEGGTNWIRTTGFERTGGEYVLGAQKIEASTTWTNAGGGFSSAAGEVEFVSRGGVVTVSNGPALAAVRIGNISSSTARNLVVVDGSSVIATGTLTLANLAGKELSVAGALEARGDVLVDGTTFSGTALLTINGAADQRLVGQGGSLFSVAVEKTTGTLQLEGALIAGSWTLRSGTVDPGTSSVTFAANQTSVTGRMTLAKMGVANRTTSTTRNLYLLGDTVLTAGDELIYHARSGINKNVSVSGGEIRLLGDLTVASNGTASASGTTRHVFCGNGDQAVSAAGAVDRFNFNVAVDKTNGAVRLESNWTLNLADCGMGVEEGTLDIGTNVLALTGARAFYSNGTERARLNVRLGSAAPLIRATGSGARVCVQGVLGVSLEKGYDPGPEAKIAIITSATPVVTVAPYGPFVLEGDGMSCQILYNDGGNNVVLTGIRRIAGGTVMLVR